METKKNGNIPCKCPKCGYEWEYEGNKREPYEWVTCYKCDRKSKLKELRMDR